MKSNNDIAAVFFDMDDTLIERTTNVLALLQATYRGFADALAPIEETDFIQTFGRKSQDMWYMMEDGVLPGDVARLYMIVNTLRALKADQSVAGAMLKDFDDRIVNMTRLSGDTLVVMDTLREAGIKVGIVTNGFTTVQTRKIERLDLHNHSDFVLISEEVRSFKPDRGIYDQAMSLAGVNAAQALFVGDNLDTDIAGAVGVGMGAVLIDPRGERARRLDKDDSIERPTHTVKCLTEVLPLAGLDGAGVGA